LGGRDVPGNRPDMRRAVCGRRAIGRRWSLGGVSRAVPGRADDDTLGAMCERRAAEWAGPTAGQRGRDK
jgi:hypothetical protein